MTSLKTKIAGLLAILTTVLPGLKTLLDNDPATSPDWNLIVAAVIAGVGLMFTRENKVTSEQAKAPAAGKSEAKLAAEAKDK